MKRQSIAVVGSGISGLSAAWLLAKAHTVTLYEQDARLGGHSHTIDVPADGGNHAVDTGFIVYNPPSYPNLTAMFDHLGVATAPSSMSFAVSLDGGACEYSGSGITGLFAQVSNVFRPAHWRMSAEIMRFFRASSALAASGEYAGLALGEWLARHGFTTPFVRRHILPMGAAIWSAPPDEMLDFPALSFARFFDNHGLLRVARRPQWRTVVGGSRSYVSRLMAAFDGAVAAGNPVTAVQRDGDGVVVMTRNAAPQRYDAVVLACHADQALRLLADADPLETRLLKPFRYTANEAVVHRDKALMPKRRRVWSSWNFIGDTASTTAPPCVTYWMNSLQPLTTRENVFVTLNPKRPPAPGSEITRITYEHPLFDRAAMTAQELLPQLQGRRGTWFAGSYCGYGFHEDGLQAGLWVAERIGGVTRPWQVTNPSARLFGGAFGRPAPRHVPAPGVAAT